MAITPNGFSVPIIKYPVLSTLGLLDPNNYGKFIETYPSLVKDSYIMKMEASGALKYTGTKTFKQWADDSKPLPSFKVTASVSGAAGAAITVTLAAGSHLGGGTLSPIAVGQVWEDDSTGTQYEVRVVTKSTAGAHTASIAPTLAATAGVVTVATSFFKYLGRPSVDEASKQQDGIYNGWTSRERDLSIFRTNKKYSDLAKFELLQRNGESYYNIDRTNLDREHMEIQEFGLMMGGRKDNMTAAAGNMNTNAEGLIPQIKRYGTDLTGASTLNDAFFQNLKRTNDADGFTTKYDVLCDTEYEIAYQTFLRTQGGGTSNIVVNVSLDGKDKTIQGIFDFSDTVKIYGQELSLKKYNYFNSARTHGADINTGIWKGSAVFIPQGSRYNEAAEGEMPYLRVRYMSDSEGGAINAFDTDGALFGKNTERVAELSLTSYKGLEMYNARAFKYAKVV